MGYIDFKDGGKAHLQAIRQTLMRRGLKMDEADDWEIHGPHRDMDDVVYVGKAYESLNRSLECFCHESIERCEKHRGGIEVAIYPRAVYVIAQSRWWSVRPEDRIPVSR